MFQIWKKIFSTKWGHLMIFKNYTLNRTTNVVGPFVAQMKKKHKSNREIFG